MLAALTTLLSAPAKGQAELPVPTKRPERPAATQEAKKLPADPVRVYQSSCPALLDGTVTGKIGKPLAEGQCGERSPLEITALNGGDKVEFSQTVTMNCKTATAVAGFADAASKIARDIYGSPIKTMVTGPGYQCRRRNRAREGKLSEHSFANAIDITAFKLEDGTTISVEEHWPHMTTASVAQEGAGAEVEAGAEPKDPVERAGNKEAEFLARSHAKACEMFTTVLGPDADAAHRTHFHFDLGCHGRNCTYLLCQ